MMSRKGYVMVSILAACVLLLSTILIAQGPPAQVNPNSNAGARFGAQNNPATAPAAAAPQPGGGQRGGPPAGGGQGGLPTAGPLSTIIGPSGAVSRPTPWGMSKAPTSDTYYLDLPLDEWPPDEFISNPDREFDWHSLKAWHHVPIIRKVTILGNRRVRPGETVQFECIVEDISGTQNGCGVGFYGPFGRRSAMNVRMSPTSPGGYIMRGVLTIPANAEPGTWRATEVNAGNDTRHSKVYWADVHPGAQNLDIEVLPAAGGAAVDVIPPVVSWVRMNNLDQPEGAIRTQPLQDPIPIYAYITDNKSGVGETRVKIMGPTTACSAATSGIPPGGPTNIVNDNPCRYIEADLQKIVGKENVFGAFVTIPEWWQGGEYRVYTFGSRDKANKAIMLVGTTSASLKNARINLTNAAANIDVTPPTLFSVWVDRTSARLGEPVTVNAIVTDNKAGVGTVSISFAPVPSYIDRARVVLKPVKAEGEGLQIQKAGLNNNSNLWSGTLTTSEWHEPGEWKVDRINARDNADNFLDLLPEYVPDLEVTVNFTGGRSLREFIINGKRGQVSGGAAPGMAAAGGAMSSAAPGPAAAGQASSTYGNVNLTDNKLTLPSGLVIDLVPGARPDPLTGKIRRIDMLPPHPPRGSCLNCHEP